MHALRRALTIGLVLLAMATRAALGQVIHVASATATELAAVDHGRAVVLLPGASLRSTDPICRCTRMATSTSA